MKIMSFILLFMLCLTPAFAEGPRGHSGGWNRGGGQWHSPSRNWSHRRSNDVGTQILGGIIGGAIGRYLFPPPVPGVAPWTQEWYDSCDQTYKSFDPQTGYYNGFDGQRHFCVL